MPGSIGSWLLKQRDLRSWTRRRATTELAAAGIPVSYPIYCAWESGTSTPTSDVLDQLVEFYDTTMSFWKAVESDVRDSGAAARNEVNRAAAER